MKSKRLKPLYWFYAYNDLSFSCLFLSAATTLIRWWHCSAIKSYRQTPWNVRQRYAQRHHFMDEIRRVGTSKRHREYDCRLLVKAGEANRDQKHTVDRTVRPVVLGRSHSQFGGHCRGHQVSLYEKVNTRYIY